MCQKKLTSACTRITALSREKGSSASSRSRPLPSSPLTPLTGGTYAYSHLAEGYAGGQAEYVRVPYADSNLLKIPSNVPDESALLLSNVLATSYHCVLDSGVKQGDIVGIWGVGPIGIVRALSLLRSLAR